MKHEIALFENAPLFLFAFLTLGIMSANKDNASHLGNTPLHLEKLKEVARKELPRLLDTVSYLFYFLALIYI